MGPCEKEADIATLKERTQNFSRRFDELSTKLDAHNLKLDLFNEKIDTIKINNAIEDSENKWKHRMLLLLYGSGGGAASFGIAKLIEHLKGL